MTRKRKRQLGKKTLVDSSDVARVRKQIPYL
jgi:ribosomal protein L35